MLRSSLRLLAAAIILPALSGCHVSAGIHPGHGAVYVGHGPRVVHRRHHVVHHHAPRRHYRRHCR